MFLFFLFFLVNADDHHNRNGTRDTRPPPQDVCYSDVSIKRCWGLSPLRLCGLQKPSCSNTKCPSCLPNSFLNNMCKKRVDKMCNSTTEPTIVRSVGEGLCPSCHKIWTRQCDEPSRRNCQKWIQHTNRSRVRLCARGERPHNFGCCFSCVPPPLTQNCSKEDISNCKMTFKDKSECKDQETPVIGSDCCRTCQIKDANNNRPNGGTGKCEYKKFRKAIQKVPECEVNEIGVTDVRNTRCTPSCRRTESRYAIKEIVDCLKTRKSCTKEGEKVRILPGDMCHRCFKPKPVCRQSCRSNQTCISEDSNVTRCERRKEFRLKIKMKVADLLAKMKMLDKIEIIQVLLEFAERFCERNEEATRCENNLGPLRDSLRCKMKREIGTDVIELVLETSERGKSRRNNVRRLLEEEGPADLLKSAVEDNTDNVVSTDLSTDEISEPEHSASFRISVSGLVVVLASMILYQ